MTRDLIRPHWQNNRQCGTIWKLARLVRQEKRGHGHYPVAHPTKKVTRGRLRTSHMLPRNHRRYTIRQLIRRMS